MLTKEPKCFHIEQPQSTPVSFAYSIMDEKDKINFVIYRGAVTSTEARVFEKIIDDISGHIPFETKFDGFYTYCVSQDRFAESSPTVFDK